MSRGREITPMISKITEFLTGKVPPQAIDMEIAVLGAILIDNTAFRLVADTLSDSDFYNEQHRLVFKACETLYKERSPIDLISVVHKLKAQGSLELAGGTYFVSSLTNKIASSSNISHHALVIRETSMLRQLIAIGAEMQRKAYIEGADPFSIQSETAKDLIKIIPDSGHDISPEAVMKKTLEIILKAMESKDGISGIPYPWPKINHHTGGLQRGNAIVIAGLPGAMKTGVVMNIEKYCNDNGIPTLFFQQEMSTEQTGIRKLSMETGIEGKKFRTGRLDNHELNQMHKAIGKLESTKSYVDSSPGLTISKLRSLGTKYVQQYGVQLIIIDYLQLMNKEQQKGENETNAWERVTREIKSIAKELNVPIIYLSQFTKEAGKDHTKIPDLSYLRGSGSIEQDADVIWIIWNPCKKLGPSFTWTNPWDLHEEISAKGKIYLIDAKNREGSNEIFEFESYPWINTFQEIRMLSEKDSFTPSSGGLAANQSFETGDSPY